MVFSSNSMSTQRAKMFFLTKQWSVPERWTDIWWSGSFDVLSCSSWTLFLFLLLVDVPSTASRPWSCSTKICGVHGPPWTRRRNFSCKSSGIRSRVGECFRMTVKPSYRSWLAVCRSFEGLVFVSWTYFPNAVRWARFDMAGASKIWSRPLDCELYITGGASIRTYKPQNGFCVSNTDELMVLNASGHIMSQNTAQTHVSEPMLLSSGSSELNTTLPTVSRSSDDGTTDLPSLITLRRRSIKERKSQGNKTMDMV